MNGYVFLAAFLASSVELVEALTLVLAVGAVNGFRPALKGTAGAVLALTVLGGTLGEGILRFVPLGGLRAGIGILSLLVGVKWLRKAILRFAGKKPRRNEIEAFSRTVDRLSTQRASGDFAAVAAAFNGVFLEGLEVIIIILTIGSGAGALGSAAAGAGLGLFLVTVAGVALHAPLARVPENVMKFVVGLMLTTFGTFWSGEAMGVTWPQGNASILFLAAGYLGASALMVRRLKAVSRPRTL